MSSADVLMTIYFSCMKDSRSINGVVELAVKVYASARHLTDPTFDFLDALIIKV